MLKKIENSINACINHEYTKEFLSSPIIKQSIFPVMVAGIASLTTTNPVISLGGNFVLGFMKEFLSKEEEEEKRKAAELNDTIKELNDTIRKLNDKEYPTLNF